MRPSPMEVLAVEVTHVQVTLANERPSNLLAFCSVTLDNQLVLHDLRVIRTPQRTIVAMPSRKIKTRCPFCRERNAIRARFCNECGRLLPVTRGFRDSSGRTRMEVDVAHPITSAMRVQIERAVLDAYLREQDNSSRPY